jgi:glutathione S-transferase
MKLLGSALSPYAVRVMLAARFKGVELSVEAPPEGLGSPELRARSPIGKIPVLVEDALVLPESDVIVHYLEDRFPNPSLFPGDAALRANARLLVRLIDNYSAPSFGVFLQNDRAGITLALQRIDTSLGYIDHFRVDGAFAVGDAFSVADCALIPFFHIFELLQEPFKAFDLVRKRARLDAWWSRARLTPLAEFARTAMDHALTELRTTPPR